MAGNLIFNNYTTNRDYYIAGQSMIYVQQPGASAYQLGLSDTPIVMSPTWRHEDIRVDAWGGQVPPEVQQMLAEVAIGMNLIHFDNGILRGCMTLAAAGNNQNTVINQAGTSVGVTIATGNEGQMPAAGARMAGSYVTMGIACPVGPSAVSPASVLWWRFPMTYITGSVTWPIGAEKSVTRLTWRALPYPGSAGVTLAATSFDPWQAGAGSAGAILWDHVAMASSF